MVYKWIIYSLFKNLFTLGKTPLQPKYKKEEIPEALADIKTRLEKMDLVFSKILDEPPENKEVGIFCIFI